MNPSTIILGFNAALDPLEGRKGVLEVPSSTAPYFLFIFFLQKEHEQRMENLR